MMAKSLKINIPADLFLALNKSEEELTDEIRLFTAIKFFEMGKLTIGKASQLAGMPQWDFENFLASHHIPISQLEISDINKDFDKLSAL